VLVCSLGEVLQLLASSAEVRSWFELQALLAEVFTLFCLCFERWSSAGIKVVGRRRWIFENSAVFVLFEFSLAHQINRTKFA
jgi:hypothetical protein